MVYLQHWHGWCHMKLQPSRRKFCVHHTTIRMVYTCLAVICQLHFCQNDRDLLHATAVTRGWNGYRNKSQHKKSTLENKFSRRSCRDSNPRPFSHESGTLTTELSPPPEREGGMGVGEEGDYIPLRWEAMRAILMFH